MVSEPAATLPPVGRTIPPFLPAEIADVRRATHKTIAAVTDDLDKFRFNRAVARIRELTNTLEDMPATAPAAEHVLREGLESVTRLIGPMMPHLAEEMWRELGHRPRLAEETRPEDDPEVARAEQGTRPRPVHRQM